MQQLSTIILTIATASAMVVNVLGATPAVAEPKLAQHSMSLQNRYPENRSVNEVFKDNILLTIAYMDRKITDPKAIDWYELNKPFTSEVVLQPNEVFVFHDDVLPMYKEKTFKTTNAHFNFQEGFKFSGALFGDGVCHLASLMYWVAKDGGLDANAPVNHDFRNIPEVAKEYGVSIYSMPGQTGTNAQQNLYITNTLRKPVVFRFVYDGKNLTVSLLPKI